MISMERFRSLDELADRWRTTEVWHEKAPDREPFLCGEIHISTGDLRDLAQLIDTIKNLDENFTFREIVGR